MDNIKIGAEIIDYSKYLPMQPASWICGEKELDYCFELLVQGGYIEKDVLNSWANNSFAFKITNKGHEFSNSLNNTIRSHSNQVFIAMWFSECVVFCRYFYMTLLNYTTLNHSE
jgi:hypothetical protein